MSYPVFVGTESVKKLSKFISELNPTSIFILVDSNTRQFCLPLILSENIILESANIIEVPTGEAEKNTVNAENIIAVLSKKNADRNTLFINVGGGVISDMGGFAASIYKRGIRFINVPTTLLSMVDASMGGKTGLNYLDKKNIIGTFSNPSAVFIYPFFLKTLSPKEVRSGYAEIFKHVILSDENKFNLLLTTQKGFYDGNSLNRLIEDSVRFKMEVTGEDFLENGRRKILNFGHTYGHALESFSQKGVRPLRHGEAVAAGMAGELFLSHKLAGFPEEKMYSAIRYLRNLYNDIHLRYSPEVIFPFLYADKKNLQDKIAFSLLSSPGKPAGIFYPSHELIHEGINFMIYEFSNAPVQ